MNTGKLTIIAILGLPGSGKTESINYLTKKYGWQKVYFGEVTFDELNRRVLEINEKNERMIREGLRSEYGRLHYAKKVIEKIEALPPDKPILVESLYDWLEYLEFQKRFGGDFITIAVYSSPQTRYARLANRTIRPLTTDEARSRDHAQIENLFQAGPIAMANGTIINEADGLESLYAELDRMIERLLV